MSIIISIAIIVSLIFANALFVAGEFSTVSAKRSKLQKLAKENKNAEAVLAILNNPQSLDTYVATCQIGITISSLVLGFYGQTELNNYLLPLIEKFPGLQQGTIDSISITVTLIILTTLQVLIGELVPKNIGIQYPEKLAMITIEPIKWITWIFKPLNVIFNGSGVLIMKTFGLNQSADHTHIHSLEEIAILVEESTKGGLVNLEEQTLITNTIEIKNTLVKDVMIPRTQMLTANINTSPTKIMSKLISSPYSRIPIYDDSVDNLIGIVHIRDLICLNFYSNNISSSLRSITHPVMVVPSTVSVKELFTSLQDERHQVAIILDEHGGTAGMVTLEDLLEEIFGELQDEFDEDNNLIWKSSNNRLNINGEITLSELDRLFDNNLFETKNYSMTLNRFLLQIYGILPDIDTEIEFGGQIFRIDNIAGPKITLISIEFQDSFENKLEKYNK